MKYESTKTYGHEQGLSCAFRQWRAESHCNRIHGYALAFRFVFGAETLDAKGWVVDFGGLKALKARLVESFDHTLAVSNDDPLLSEYRNLNLKKLADVVVFERVGCEAFAQIAFRYAQEVLKEAGYGDRVKVVSAECMEHAGNSAIYRGE